MAQRLRIGGVQDVARVAIHHNVGIGRRTGRLADKKAERGSKTENAPTKPVAGSRPEPQHDYFPRPRPRRLQWGADTPLVPRRKHWTKQKRRFSGLLLPFWRRRSPAPGHFRQAPNDLPAPGRV